MRSQMINRAILFLFSLFVMVSVPRGNCAEASTNSRPLLTHPLSLPEAIELALQQNANVLKGRADLEAAYGLVLQTRAIVLPSVRSTGNFQAADPGLREQFPTPLPLNLPDNTWFVDIRVTQSLYEGGRMKSALREAKLTKEQAVSQFESVIADTVLDVQLAYYDVLLAQQQILVQEASVNLLTNQLANTRARFEAGTVRPFNVLRAEVELANAQPRLIRARNASRIAKNNLATLLGFDIPKDVWDDIPLNLSDKLEARPMSIELPSAIGQALDRRPELMVFTKAERLRREQINDSRAGYKPSLRAYGGYQARNFSFSDDIADEVHGWTRASSSPGTSSTAWRLKAESSRPPRFMIGRESSCSTRGVESNRKSARLTPHSWKPAKCSNHRGRSSSRPRKLCGRLLNSTKPEPKVERSWMS